MFGFFKKKLKDVLKKFSKNVEEEADVVEDVEVKKEEASVEEPVQEDIPETNDNLSEQKETEDNKPEKDKLAEKKEDILHASDKIVDTKTEKSENEVVVNKNEDDFSVSKDVQPKKRSFLGKISDAFSKKVLTEDKFEELFFDLEVILLENNTAVEVIDKIKADLKSKLVDVKLSRKQIYEIIKSALEESVKEILSIEELDILEMAKASKPFKILMIGVNGSGKTTTLAKLGHYFKSHGLSCVFAASDTFRAAAIQQLEEHSNRLGIKLIKQDYGADAAAVAFDAVKFAESKNIDVVLIDSAGRLHSNVNLMNELSKIVRVVNPDLKIFVGEALTGNDAIEQAKKFEEFVGIDGIILTKADVDDKGGVELSISYVTKKPILFLGTGQNYDDLQKFNKEEVLRILFGQ